MASLRKSLFILLAFCFYKSYGQDYEKQIEKFREDYKNEFVLNPRSPLKKEDLEYLKFFPANEKFRVSAVFTRTAEAQQFDMATYSGRTKPFVKYGYAVFDLDGKKVTISIYQNLGNIIHPVYKDYLFIPFKDLTSGTLTYGGGRYIDILISDIKDNIAVIDFNKAYNPYCAYSDGYNCPIPPDENDLGVEIKAGEMKFAKAGH